MTGASNLRGFGHDAHLQGASRSVAQQQVSEIEPPQTPEASRVAVDPDPVDRNAATEQQLEFLRMALAEGGMTDVLVAGPTLPGSRYSIGPYEGRLAQERIVHRAAFLVGLVEEPSDFDSWVLRNVESFPYFVHPEVRAYVEALNRS